MMPKSVLTTEASQEGLAVLISKTPHRRRRQPGLSRPGGCDATASKAKYKRSGGTNDLYIVPLANAAQTLARHGQSASGGDGEGHRARSEAIIIADADTPSVCSWRCSSRSGQTSSRNST